MAAGALFVLIITTVWAMRIVGMNFLGTANTSMFLNSIGSLDFGIEDDFLEEFDNPKTNEWN